MSDEEFLQQITNFLAKAAGNQTPSAIPVIYDDQGKLNHNATLELACYEGLEINYV